MVEEIVTKRLGLVLMITTHMVISGPGQAEVTGIVSHNVTLQFTFNDAITAKSHFAVYTTGPQKMAECSPRKGHTGTYWATLFTEGGQTRPSPSVHLIVQEENSHDTNSHEQENSTTTKYQPRESSPLFFGPIFAVLVVSLVVLLAATLPCFFWRCVRARDCSAEENSQPATQVPPAVPEPTFVYSVMDFPMRQATHLKEKPIGTYYCSIRYHPNQKK
ncbi:uncharacterized protein LOC129189333 isoform X2 [Dunckerocampus dactyliophorus]|uniref:uncharacterized protein LOC129189333 isoform X2 n=1 Tax=Dunckerocampus dactyliophorus TaxID=161453 RepID=UPI002406E558|nr:uncharacterized protein LOC129189333 isoform X2 [Dunckerocampus dactyliophorus]